MHIIIDEIHRRIHLHAFGQRPHARPGAELRAWEGGTDAWQARRFMDRHFRDAGRLHILRHALTLDGHDGAGPAQRSDDEVLQAGARRLAAGAWRIACEVAAAPAVVRSVPASATSPLLGGGASTRMSRGPAAPVRRASAPAPIAATPAPAPDWPNAAAQVAQAETLTRAARDGTPFCEICEAHRRAAAEAAA